MSSRYYIAFALLIFVGILLYPFGYFISAKKSDVLLDNAAQEIAGVLDVARNRFVEGDKNKNSFDNKEVFGVKFEFPDTYVLYFTQTDSSGFPKKETRTTLETYKLPKGIEFVTNAEFRAEDVRCSFAGECAGYSNFDIYFSRYGHSTSASSIWIQLSLDNKQRRSITVQKTKVGFSSPSYSIYIR